MTNEIWRDIQNIGNYTGDYQVSNLGRLKRNAREIIVWNRHQHCTRKYKEYIFTSKGNDKDGYTLVGIGGKTYRLHRLVALEFLENDDPKNKIQINHKNGIKDDNRIENLEWATPSDNQQHSYDELGDKGPIGTKNGNNVHSSKTILKIKDMLENSGLMQKEIAEIVGVRPVLVSQIKLGTRWSHLTGYKYNGRIKKFKGKVR